MRLVCTSLHRMLYCKLGGITEEEYVLRRYGRGYIGDKRSRKEENMSE